MAFALASSGSVSLNKTAFSSKAPRLGALLALSDSMLGAGSPTEKQKGWSILRSWGRNETPAVRPDRGLEAD